MKLNRYFLLFAFFTLLSCKQSFINGYQISGNIPNGNGKIYLEDFASNNITVLEEAEVINGHYKLKGYAEEGFYRLAYDGEKTNYIPIYIKPNVKISIDINVKDNFSYTVKGDKDNEQLLAILNFNIKSQSEYLKIKIQIDSSKKNTNTDSLKMLLTQNRINHSEKIHKLIEDSKTPEVAVFAMNFIVSEPSEMEYIVKKINQLYDIKSNSIYLNAFRNEFLAYRNSLMGDESSGIKINGYAPEINLPNPNGDSIKLSSLKGKIVLLDFWASWCSPCRNENPNVVKLYNKYKKYGFTVYSVSLDSKIDAWKEAINNDKLIWPYHVSELRGWESKVVNLYKINLIPSTFLIDDKGKIIDANLKGKALENRIEELMKGRSVDSTFLN